MMVACTAGYSPGQGSLAGKRATIHWENQDSFAEEFLEVELTKSVFIVDGNRVTTAGGMASIDLMLKFIAEDHGEELANAVADQLIYSSIRTDQDTQRLSIPTRIGVRHPRLSQVIQQMELNIEELISLDSRQGRWYVHAPAGAAFRRYLNRSPKRYYMELRLQKARNLLMQTDMACRGSGLRICLTLAFLKCTAPITTLHPTGSVAQGSDERLLRLTRLPVPSGKARHS